VETSVKEADLAPLTHLLFRGEIMMIDEKSFENYRLRVIAKAGRNIHQVNNALNAVQGYLGLYVLRLNQEDLDKLSDSLHHVFVLTGVPCSYRDLLRR